ncbi:MAG: YihY family inner membrane protein [Francisellaceae bacterium]
MAMVDFKHYVKRFYVYWVWVFREYFYRNCLIQATSLTLTSLFALVPLLMVFLSIFSLLPAFKQLQDNFQNIILENMLPSSGQSVLMYLQHLTLNRVGLPVTAVIVLFIISILMIRSVERVLNSIWHIRRQRPAVTAFLLYWAVLTLGPLLFGSGIAISSYLLSRQWLGMIVFGYEKLFISALPVVFNFLVLLFIYKVVPYTRVKFLHAAAGALFAAVLIEIAKKLFGWYVLKLPTYELVYGALSIIPVFILWVLLSWQIFLLAAVVSFGLSVSHTEKQKTMTDELDVLLSILGVLYQAQQQKISMTTGQIASSVPGIGRDRLQQLLKQLVLKRYINVTQASQYSLNCDLAHETILNFYQSFMFYLNVNAKDDDTEAMLKLRRNIAHQLETPLSRIIKI